MPLSIRRAHLADLPAITGIYNEGIATRMATADVEPFAAEDRGTWFAQFDDRNPIWAGSEDGQVICFGALPSWSPRPGYRHAAETSVYVNAARRGQGHGRAMLEHLVGEAGRIGLHYLIARIFTGNDASRRLHEALGFKVLAVQREIVFLDGQWRDVTLMDRLV